MAQIRSKGFKSFRFKDATYTRDQLLPDIVKPNVIIDIVDTTLDDADRTSQVTFTFSEAIGAGSFALADMSVANGVLSNLTIAANGLSAAATFTATDNLKGTGSVSVAASKFTDLAGNQNNPSNTATVAIDTQNPGVTVDIVDPTLNDADNTSQVTFSFSEAIAAGSFTLADVSVANGVLSNLTIAADDLSAAATFTATDDVNANGLVSVAADTFTDGTGNQNTASNIDSVSINTKTDARIEGGSGPDTLRGTPGSDIMDGKGGSNPARQCGCRSDDRRPGERHRALHTRTVTLDLKNGDRGTAGPAAMPSIGLSASSFPTATTRGWETTMRTSSSAAAAMIASTVLAGTTSCEARTAMIGWSERTATTGCSAEKGETCWLEGWVEIE